MVHNPDGGGLLISHPNGETTNNLISGNSIGEREASDTAHTGHEQ